MALAAAEAEELLEQLELIKTLVDLVAMVRVKLLYHLLHKHFLVEAAADLVTSQWDLVDLVELEAEPMQEAMLEQTLEAAAEAAAL